MIRRAFLEEQGRGKLIHEMELLRDAFARRGLPVTLFTAKRLLRRQLPIDGESLVAGQMPTVHAAMKQLGIPEPPPADYPECLRDLLRRRVWRSTLGEVEHRFVNEVAEPVFVKPAGRRKRFTGVVVAWLQDLAACEGTSRREPVWCSDVVRWVSEHRAYVIGGRVAALDRYAGAEDAPPDPEVLDEAVRRLTRAGQAPAAFAIDVGVLSTGETAIVEVNDGYSIGAYEVGADVYADFTLARWEELLASRGAPPPVSP